MTLSSVCFSLALFSGLFIHPAEAYVTQEHSWYKDYYPQGDQYCAQGCLNGVGSINYTYTPLTAGDPDQLYYLNEASNTLKIKSLYYCVQKYCTPEEAVSGLGLFNGTVQAYAGISIPPVAQYHLNDTDLAQVLVVNKTVGFATAAASIDYPAIPDAEWYSLSYRTLAAFYTNWDVSYSFTFGLIGFWGFVVLVGLLHRAFYYMRNPGSSQEPGWWLWIRRTLILPATFAKHQCEPVGYSFTIPPRLESITLFLYLILNIVCCFPAYDLFIGNQYYATPGLQLARYVSDRAGFLAIAQFPMVWIFAARNDPLLWLTGWSFATYNRFHRWIARISALLAVIHSIGYTVMEFMEGKEYYYEAFVDLYWQAGVAAVIIMTLMLPLSSWYLREKMYDLFLVVHIVLAIALLAMMWYHVRIFNGAFNYYLYPCIAIWVAERVLRFGRTFFVSIVPHFTKGVQATVTYHRTSDIIRMDVSGLLLHDKITPGQFYYIYIPSGLRAYESHPFTLCSWTRSDTDSFPEYTLGGSDTKTTNLTVQQLNHNQPGEPVHTFLIRPYKGMTARLQKRLLALDESVASTQQTVFLEGPYGDKLDLSHYSDVLVICGGSGITAAISHSHFLMSANSATKVHIVWSVPQRHLPDDICANELASVITTDRVKMTVFLTSSAAQEAHSPDKLPAFAPYEIKLGRPDVEQTMREHKELAAKNLAIVTCGTPQFSDNCRKAVVQILKEGGMHVGYYNETLVW